MSKILNNNNFLLIINEISNRLNKLEEKNLELTKIIEDIQKNNINKSSKILDKIENKSTPSILYNDWIEHIFLLIPSKLEIVFKNDLLKGIYQLLKESIENFESIPICAYNKKKLVFYYYNKETEKKVYEPQINQTKEEFTKEQKTGKDKVNKLEDVKQ